MTDYGAGSGSKGSVTNYSTGPKRTTTNYGSVKNVSDAQPNKKVGFGKEFPMGIFDLKKTESNDLASSQTGLGYAIGDPVSHVKFGSGKVMAIDNATKDYMVTVDFADYGVKKMLAGFANLKKQ